VKITLNIEKKHFWVLLVLISFVSVAIFVYAVSSKDYLETKTWTNSADKVGHRLICATIEAQEPSGTTWYQHSFVGGNPVGDGDGTTVPINDVIEPSTASHIDTGDWFALYCNFDNGWIMTGCSQTVDHNGGDMDLWMTSNGCKFENRDDSHGTDGFIRCCKVLS